MEPEQIQNTEIPDYVYVAAAIHEYGKDFPESNTFTAQKLANGTSNRDNSYLDGFLSNKEIPSRIDELEESWDISLEQIQGNRRNKYRFREHLEYIEDQLESEGIEEPSELLEQI